MSNFPYNFKDNNSHQNQNNNKLWSNYQITQQQKGQNANVNNQFEVNPQSQQQRQSSNFANDFNPAFNLINYPKAQQQLPPKGIQPLNGPPGIFSTGIKNEQMNYQSLNQQQLLLSQQQNNQNYMQVKSHGVQNLQGVQAFPLNMNSQVFPSFRGTTLIPANRKEEKVENILDSSELEKQMQEESEKEKERIKISTQIKTNHNETDQQQEKEITDVSSLFSKIDLSSQGDKNDSDIKDNNLLARTKQGVYLIDYQKQQTADESTKITSWNEYSYFIQDGNYLVCADTQNIGVFSTRNKKLLDHKQKNDIQSLILSPLQKYIVCIEKPDESDLILCQILDALNLQVHKQMEFMFFQKNRPNLILFNKNETQFFIREKRELQIYETNNFELIQVVNCENYINQFLSPAAEQQRLLLLTPEFSKGYQMIPAQLKLYNLIDLETPILNLSISKSQEIIPVWSPNGKNLLVWCSTIKDDTDNTYYGKHIIYKFNEINKQLEQMKFYKGVIHDIKWQPNSDHFVVVGGGMPSHTVLFSSEGAPLYEFGRHHINKIFWNPFSQLLFLGGFGNLGGDIEVWQIDELQKIGQFNAHCTISSIWSFDGSKILCGVLFPKLRVQNNCKVFDCYGNLCKVLDFSSTDLYEIAWQPYPSPYAKDISKIPQKTKSTEIKSLTLEENTEKPKKGMLTKRGNFSEKLNNQKPVNHGGKKLLPNEDFLRAEDKEMEKTKIANTYKFKDQGPVISRNKNKFIDQQQPLTEDEEMKIFSDKKAQQRKQKLFEQKFVLNNLNQDQILKKQIDGNNKIDNVIKRKEVFILSEDKNNSNNWRNFEGRRKESNGEGSEKETNGSESKQESRKESHSIKNDSSGIRTNSPEFDDFFDQTDEIDEQDRLKIQAISKK